MSDDTTPTTGADTGGGSGNYTPPATQAELDRIIADRLSRERSKYADYEDLQAKAQRLAEIEEANKTEAEKAAEQLATLQAKVAEYETREQINAWKADVSKETGVPAAVLAGNTLEEIQAHAESLKPLITPSAQPAAAQTVPTIGNQPDRPAQSVPLKDQIAAAEAAGDKALVATLKAMQLSTVQ